MAPRRSETVVPMESLFGYTLRRLSVTLMGSLARRLSDLDLRIAEASVLITIGRNEGITQIEAGRALGIQRANMVPLTAALITRGLVSRQVADGRSQALELTAAGRKLAARALAVMHAHDDAFAAGLSSAEKENLVEMLRRLGTAEANAV